MHILRGSVVVAVIVLLVGVIGAGAATSGTSPLTNAKHFFWAQGQSSSASSSDQLQNDLIYHGGNVGSGAIGVEQKPAVYLIWWGPQWAGRASPPRTRTAPCTRARRSRPTSPRSSRTWR